MVEGLINQNNITIIIVIIFAAYFLAFNVVYTHSVEISVLFFKNILYQKCFLHIHQIQYILLACSHKYPGFAARRAGYC
jgi:hypothetical protein